MTLNPFKKIRELEKKEHELKTELLRQIGAYQRTISSMRQENDELRDLLGPKLDKLVDATITNEWDQQRVSVTVHFSSEMLMSHLGDPRDVIAREVGFRVMRAIRDTRLL